MRWFRRRGAEPHDILLFGNGLLGSAVAGSIRKRGDWTVNQLDWHWSDASQRLTQVDALLDLIRQSSRIDIIWAAGVSGFGSTKQDMETETALVAELIDVAATLRRDANLVVFHLMSSLGGLFEGQSWIGLDTAPQAQRNYGIGKLAQEAALLARSDVIVPRIYRPSSVYGYAPNGRRGLFAAIFAAVITHKNAVISGSPHTLRDFVFAQDVGDFIGMEATDPLESAQPASFLLASGKPTSLVEAIGEIEAITGRRYYGRFEKAPGNALDMTVMPSAVPARMQRTPLQLGMRQVYQAMLKSLIVKA